MPRGLGKTQRAIKTLLQSAWEKKIGMLRFADIRAVFIKNLGGEPERNKLNPILERSLKRSLKALVDRGDVVFFGEGGQTDPYRYTTVEAFAAASGKKVRDTAHAKQIVAELLAAASGLPSA